MRRFGELRQKVLLKGMAHASARDGTFCPCCLEDWDVNGQLVAQVCCMRKICETCSDKLALTNAACPLCREPTPVTDSDFQSYIQPHVEKEVPEALSFLGELFEYGEEWGYTKNAYVAALVYKRAVELGNVNAMVRLARLFLRGEGVTVDTEKALELNRQAAARGHSVAQINVAHILSKTSGDRDEIFRFTKLAADQGYTHAETSLAQLFEDGFGVEKDLAEAMRWYARAAAKGDETAIAAVAELKSLQPPDSIATRVAKRKRA